MIDWRTSNRIARSELILQLIPDFIALVDAYRGGLEGYGALERIRTSDRLVRSHAHNLLKSHTYITSFDSISSIYRTTTKELESELIPKVLYMHTQSEQQHINS